MGYMNYYLKDLDIIERRMWNSHSSSDHKNTYPKKQFICPYCQLICNDINALYNHVKKTHYVSDCMIVVNNKIIHEQEISYILSLESVDIILYKKDSIVKIDDCIYDNNGQLNDIIKDKFFQNREVKITVGKKYYQLKCYSVELIDMSKINSYVNEWNNLVISNKPVNNIYDNNLNDFEIKYLNGLYNYFIAVNANKFEKGQRYIDSYGLLNQFNPINAQGLMILKIVSFRLNWIDVLESLCNENDEFKDISDFYHGRENNLLLNDKSKMNQIYIEDEILLNIQAFINFIRGDKKSVDEYLNQFIIEEIDDKNLKDRICLLKSLRCIDQNRKYRYYANEIGNNSFINLIERYKEVRKNGKY